MKTHRNYSVDEISRLFGIHKNTVRQWIKQGLPTIDDRRPTLVLGQELIAFLRDRRTRNKRRCRPNEMYCVRCRAPRTPAGDMADYRPTTGQLGVLVGICPACDTLMHRRSSLARLEEIQEYLDVTITQSLKSIGDMDRSLVNSDLEQEH